jgi:peptidoglycan/xylan/chitin deacetylase (PgdA/CDA1 family)
VNVYFTVDVEQDCPPYLNTWRGLDEGMPRLLAMLNEEGVPGTFFTTGETARRFPAQMRAIVDGGHELGCHGDTHRSFAEMTAEESEAEIAASSATLRAFGPVASFRAPYLRFPAPYVPLLKRHHYTLDSSEGRHKKLGASVHVAHDVLRVPASVTSSTLRWPAAVRDRLFARLNEPVVLFVHPWEFVDLRRERLRFDCRFKTGDEALDSARSALRFFAARGAAFGLMRDCVEP